MAVLPSKTPESLKDFIAHILLLLICFEKASVNSIPFLYALKKRINSYDFEERRLIRLFRHGEISEDSILDELNQLKKDREEDNGRLAHCAETRKRLTSLVKAEIKLIEYCERVRQNLDNCSFEDKRLALNALDIKVTAPPDCVDIKGVIPMDITPNRASAKLLTTGQTSA